MTRPSPLPMLVPVALFSSARRAAPYLGGLVLGTTIYGVDTFVPLFVQGARGGTAGAAGAVVTPLVLAWSVSATLAARAIVRVGFRERSGADVAAQVLGQETPPDALVCANDELALSTMKALQYSGIRIPEDIAIVGWDDVMTARYVTPGLTTVRQPLYELGRAAATRLHERIAGAPTAPEPLILPTELVLRTSCGCPERDDRDEPWVTT